MKMGFVFSGVFWGVILILLGVSIVLNVVFGVKIPLFRIVFALVLIYLGIRMLTGLPFWRKTPNAAVFEDKRIEAAGASDRYDVVFGKGVIDLTKLEVKDRPVKIEATTAFGSSVIIIDPAVSAKIKVTSAFAGARMPDGNVIVFGEYTYKTPGLKNAANYVLLEATVVFGGMEIVEKANIKPEAERKKE